VTGGRHRGHDPAEWVLRLIGLQEDPTIDLRQQGVALGDHKRL
jgi:hypothetical protein